jgi:GTP pyrophosphokinase
MSLSKLVKSPEEMRKVTERFGLSSETELFVAVGYGKVSPRALCDFLAPPKEGDKASEPPVSIREGRIESLVRKVTGKDAQGIRLNGIDDVLVRYTKCCNPLPGDEIIGFITRGRGITVHRRNCPKAFDTDPERRVEISWDSRAKINRPVQIKVMTANRPGILATVGHTFHEQGINISEATCRAGDDGRATNTFTFLCSDLAQLKNVIRQLQRIPGVMAVERT